MKDLYSKYTKNGRVFTPKTRLTNLSQGMTERHTENIETLDIYKTKNKKKNTFVTNGLSALQ